MIAQPHEGGVRVVIAGGGTGGHLYPGIAVARALQDYSANAAVSFVGTAAGIEARVIPREGFPLDFIRASGLKGKAARALLRGMTVLPLGAADAWRVIARRRPDLVIGVGGYSSGPVVALAALRGIPTMVLEQNAVPGLTNRLLATLVRAAAVTYEVTLPYFHGKAFVSGNPVRPEFFRAAQAKRTGESGALRILIFGGSQGAHAINMAMVAAAPELASNGERVSITHQTGQADLEMVREAYRQARLDARVEPFLYAMAEEMSAADLVVCRAGATTLAELAAAARAAVLIPFPQATDDHQRKNAEVLARAGAAMLLDQRDLDGKRLAAMIRELAEDRPRLDEMANSVRQFARPDAARLIVERGIALVPVRKGR